MRTEFGRDLFTLLVALRLHLGKGGLDVCFGLRRHLPTHLFVTSIHFFQPCLQIVLRVAHSLRDVIAATLYRLGVPPQVIGFEGAVTVLDLDVA